MIYFIVNTEEAVVRQTECFNFNWCILSIMTVYVKLELSAYLLSIDNGRDIDSPFIEQGQYGFIHIVVDKDNAFLRTLYQIGHECIGT